METIYLVLEKGNFIGSESSKGPVHSVLSSPASLRANSRFSRFSGLMKVRLKWGLSAPVKVSTGKTCERADMCVETHMNCKRVWFDTPGSPLEVMEQFNCVFFLKITLIAPNTLGRGKNEIRLSVCSGKHDLYVTFYWNWWENDCKISLQSTGYLCKRLLLLKIKNKDYMSS